MSHQIKSLRSNYLKNKKGISVMVGYVLLVAFAVVIGVITYTWIKTYIPTESIECSDGVSLFVEDTQFNPITNRLTIDLKNNGRFDIDGYFIQVKNDSEQEIANMQIAEYLILGGEELGSAVRQTINLNGVVESVFELPDALGEPLSATITPFQYKVFGNRERLVNCGDARVSQSINVLETLYVFVEDSGGFNGDFGGLSGADAICDAAGDNIETGTYIAWLSNDTDDAKDRISEGIYVLPDNATLIANNKEDLIDGTTLVNPINQNENGGPVSSQGGGIWTGTDEFGVALENNCDNWESGSGGNYGIRGRVGQSDSEWTNSNTESCNDGARGIYCFQIS